MDERQAQIRERAGLEESNLNQDFIDFLRKYGFLLLLLAAIAGGGTSVKRWWDQYQQKKVDAAFADFEAARAGGNASPEVLANVADDHAGVRAVSILARLESADAYLRGVRKGLKAGAQLDAEGKVENPDDLMSDADRDTYLTKAAAMYQRVIDDAGKDTGQTLIKVGAYFGLASVAECRREFDKARTYYEQVQKHVDGTTFSAQGAVARARIAALPVMADMPKLVARADLPDIPAQETPEVPALPTPPPAEAPQLNLEPVQVTPGTSPDAPVAVPVAQPVPPPAETPATPPAQPEAPKPAEPKPAEPKPDQPADPK